MALRSSTIPSPSANAKSRQYTFTINVYSTRANSGISFWKWRIRWTTHEESRQWWWVFETSSTAWIKEAKVWQVLVSRLGYPLFRKRPNRRGWKVAPLRRKLRVLCIPAFEHDKGILTVPAPSIRTNSANNVTQTQVAAETIEKLAPEKPFSGRDLPRRERPGLAILQKTPQTTQPVDDSPSLSPGSDTDSELGDDDDDSDENDMLTSRRLPGVRRFGKYSMHKPSLRDNLDDDDDDSPAFLPLARENEVNVQHMNSTLRQQNNIPETSRRQMAGYTPSHRRELVSLDSSASSGVAIGSPRAGPQRSTEPLSPRRVANLSRQSSRQQGSANQSSEETPSMGSSFSDLDGISPQFLRSS